MNKVLKFRSGTSDTVRKRVRYVQSALEEGKRLMKVLVVDDELPICELLDEFLSEEGFQVYIATSGEEALSLFEKEDPHMVLLDIKMPGMDGMDVLRRIREIDSRSGVIMISAFSDSSTVREALQKGANHYMEKPIELARLNELLVEWQNTNGGGGNNEIN